MTEEKVRVSGEVSRPADAPILPTVNPAAEQSEPPKAAVHPAFYVMTWIFFSSSVILFNKWILSTVGFHFPIFLTSWHLGFATLMTQILARTTNLLDGRKTVKMTGRVYLRAIVPIGIFFSLSLICGNLTYLYLSVSFIQMLKATTPVAVLLTSWALGVAEPNMKTLFNVSFIVIGVIGGILFEAIRIVMVQRLLSSAEFKMDPLVSLYYFAPVCAIMNFLVALFWEIPTMTMGDFYNVGFWTLLANAMCAFMLNVSVVFLIGKTSVLIFTLCGGLEGYSPRLSFCHYLGNFHHSPPMFRLRHCSRWNGFGSSLALKRSRVILPKVGVNGQISVPVDQSSVKSLFLVALFRHLFPPRWIRTLIRY
ncbi:hypothetical protein EYC84_004658 [Monilinia fructicola]|uniref:Sugar phosphate transporter domain-containing protein n=1 Tax=Monilinia fructicola TaxID=38448 RepID=A0A5M9K4Z0_MONFR|nr:hypothetical protein EYC84_004658 [Monilinia fructicola]